MNQVWRDLLIPGVPWYALVIRAIVAWVAVLVLLRVAGKRQVAQMGMAEFVALLLISNAVQNSMNGGDNSLSGGLLLALVLIVLTRLFAWLTYRSRKLEMLVQGRPTLLIHHGKIMRAHLAKELLTVAELRHLLRKQGIHDMTEICEAVLESDGYISVIKKNEEEDKEEKARRKQVVFETDECFPRSDVY